MSESNGDGLHVVVGAPDPHDGRALVQAYFQHRVRYTDRINPYDGFARERSVDRIKTNLRADPEFRNYERQVGWNEPYSPQTVKDEDNLFRWIDGFIVDEAQRQTAELPVDITPTSIGKLRADHPHLREPIFDGLLRRTETLNLISLPKIGKSWMVYQLSLCKVMGWDWLGHFPCPPGRVLIVDNELHAPTMANRLAHSAKCMEIAEHQYSDDIDVINLRGRLIDLHGIARIVEQIEAGKYDLIVLDAFYRSLPEGVSENDNAQMMRLFNVIDGTAEKAQAGWVNVHHATKGSQSDKSVTDVGAGAGSQSRAADCHCVLRPHEESGVYVFEAAVRSFKPVEPIALRWEFPLWLPATDADPTLLKGRLSRSEQRNMEKDKTAMDKLVDAMRKADEPLSIKRLRPKIGAGPDRTARLLEALIESGDVIRETTIIKGNECDTYRLA